MWTKAVILAAALGAGCEYAPPGKGPPVAAAEAAKPAADKARTGAPNCTAVLAIDGMT